MLCSFLINTLFLKLVCKSEKALPSQELIALTQIQCFPNERKCTYFQAAFEYLCSEKECLSFPWITFFFWEVLLQGSSLKAFMSVDFSVQYLRRSSTFSVRRKKIEGTSISFFNFQFVCIK